MRMMLNRGLAVLVLLASFAAVPALGADSLQPAVLNSNSTGGFVPVIFKSSFRDMKVEEVAAIAAGAAVVGTVADMFFDSGLVTMGAIAIGAAVGSYWYEEEMWPFSE
ncbi:hypothetical protein TI04_05550 [Achromatium sp. WMS2]|nr:hypothetical protein TI04_05550 [Achromatium sp. WMS2]